MIKKIELNKKVIAIIIFIILFTSFLYFINSVDKPELVTSKGRTFEKAKVIKVLKDNIQEDGRRYGEQIVEILMLTGPLKGETVEATSSAGYLFGSACKPNMKVVVIQSISGNINVTSVYTKDREFVIYIYIIIFLITICLVGGKQGIKSSLSLIFTFICLIFLYIPLIFRGFSPFWAAVIISCITTIVTMYLVGGTTKKTICAIIGTVIGVIIAGVSATIFGYFADISGYNVSDIESLLFIGDVTNIKIGGLLFSGLLISSLGAIMDVAMSISSTMNEIHIRKPELSKIELFYSGMNVGRDMMGTMSNTLILAFAGGSVSVLISNYVYDLPYLQIINSYNIGIEIMQGISGSIGIILTVPIVALISSLYI